MDVQTLIELANHNPQHNQTVVRPKPFNNLATNPNQTLRPAR
jgi:hypothetical protein